MVPNNSWTLRADSAYSGQITRFCLLLVMCLGTLPCGASEKRRFTVADDIELTHFAGDPYTGALDYAVRFSPDRLYFRHIRRVACSTRTDQNPRSVYSVPRTYTGFFFILRSRASPHRFGRSASRRIRMADHHSFSLAAGLKRSGISGYDYVR